MKPILTICLSISLFSCNHRPHPTAIPIPLRDSLIKPYLAALADPEDYDPADSCIHQSRLQDLPADEAYRFIFSEAFCRDKLNITVSKSKDSINLHCIIYSSIYYADGRPGTSSNIRNEYNKRLTRQQWDHLTTALEKANFWELRVKKINEEKWVDGDDITVTGYKEADTAFNRPAQFHKVIRRIVHYTPLYDPFKMILQLSGGRQGCIYLD